MKKIKRTVLAVLLLVSMLLIPVRTTSYAADDYIGYYAGENGRFSFSLSENNYCYWYQDGTRYAGKYQAKTDGFEMNLVGSGTIMDTSFRAEKQKNGSLRVYGGIVDGELFTKTEKPQDIRDVDQMWAKRIRHSKKSSGKINLKETVLLNQNDIRITATGYSANGNDEGIRLLLENDGEHEVVIMTASVLINDKVADVSFFSRLAPHETGNEILRIKTVVLEALKVEKIETISIAFSIEIQGQPKYVSEKVSIPIQDSRNRVPVLIPIGKTIFASDKLWVELVGYENTGFDVELYYLVQNDAEAGFTARTTKTSLNEEEGSKYALNQDVEANSAVLYQGSFNKADYSATGKLNTMEFDLQLQSSYSTSFVCFNRIRMEFEPDGQICSFESTAKIDEDSDFWKENFVTTTNEPENKQSRFDKEWKNVVRDYMDAEEYDSIAVYLKSYAYSDPEAKIIRAAFLSMEEEPEEDYRAVIAELIDAGEDPVLLLETASREVFGVVLQLDYDGMALNTYCEGNYSTAFSIAAYQAEQGSIFCRSLIAFGMLYYPHFEDEIARIGISREEFKEWLASNIAAGDPAAMYIQAEINIAADAESEVDYYEKAAKMLIKLAEGESIPQPDAVDSAGINLFNGLGFSTTNPLISFFIGECYRYGDGSFPQDFNQSEEWYHTAADRGLPEARLNYGHILLRKIMSDQVPEENYADVVDECYFYLASAADIHERSLAQYDLAILYMILGDMEDGEIWMKKAAENGNIYAETYVNKNVLTIIDWM